MLKTVFTATALMALPAFAATAGTIVLPVGPSQTFTTIAAAVNAANGDNNPANYYVITVAPGTYTNDTATVTRPMTIEAAQPGSAVILNETVALPNQKGILISFAQLTIDGLTFQGAFIDGSLGANGAGIRAEGSQGYTLTVRNSRFISNQTGILTDVNFPLDVVLTNNVFINNGNGNTSSLTHGVYIGSGNNSLTAVGNEFCGTIVGHNIKSRAAVTIIENNTLYAGAADPNQPSCNVGSASYALDIPNGGVAVVSGNTMIQGTATQNGNMFAYGEEGLTYPTNSLAFINNQMQNTLPNAIGINDPNGVAVIGNGNSFAPSITTQVNPPSANQLTGNSGSFSPDGTISLAPSGGALVSTTGSWTWGPATTIQPTQCGGCYQTYLNGSNAGGNASKMEVAHGGQLYAYNSWGWFVWTGSWTYTSAP
jgi:hypothetical protein